MENLARLCRLIAEKRDAIPHYDYRNDASTKAHKDAVQALADELSAAEGAIFKNSPEGTLVKLSGIRATSTSGVLGALSNWRAAAQKKIASGLAPFHDGGVVAAKPEQPSFQEGVAQWLLECFGPVIVADKTERADRFIEEALELVQSVGYPATRVMSLLSYVYSRPAGEPHQEIGGTMVTLAAFCVSHNIDMDEAAKTELARVWTKIEAIRAKQAAKPTGSALPVDDGHYPHADNEAVDLLIAAAKMKNKLFLARRKGRSGWDDPTQCTNADLSRMLREHVEKGDPVDVANFCAFLIARGERIGPAAFTVDPLEEHLKGLINKNPEKARLAAGREDLRMWFVAELTSVASGHMPLTEIEALVSRYLTTAEGGEA